LEFVSSVIDDTRRNRMWIVVGYSGEGDDPVFAQLCRVREFSDRLFWVGFRDRAPARHLAERLLDKGKAAHYVQGEDDQFGADGFFIDLLMDLGIFPPTLLANPFRHVAETISLMPALPSSGTGNVKPLAADWFPQLFGEHTTAHRTEIEHLEKAAKAQYLLRRGRYAACRRLCAEILAENTEHAGSLHIDAAAAQQLAADAHTAEEREALFRDAEAGRRHIDRIGWRQATNARAWAFLLIAMARNAAGLSEKVKLLRGAVEKTDTVLLDNEDDHGIRSTGAWCRIALALLLTNECAEWLAQAQRECEEALRRDPTGAASFASMHLARVHAMRGDEATAREWLEYTAQRRRLFDEQDVRADDPALENVRSCEWFGELIDPYFA
jgi:hypothetical protein